MEAYSLNAEILAHREKKSAAQGQPLVPLEEEYRSLVPNDVAARHLGRSPQTLRSWCCCENGPPLADGRPIQPVRVHRRLMWRTVDLRYLLGVTKTALTEAPPMQPAPAGASHKKKSKATPAPALSSSDKLRDVLGQHGFLLHPLPGGAFLMVEQAEVAR